MSLGGSWTGGTSDGWLVNWLHGWTGALGLNHSIAGPRQEQWTARPLWRWLAAPGSFEFYCKDMLHLTNMLKSALQIFWVKNESIIELSVVFCTFNSFLSLQSYSGSTTIIIHSLLKMFLYFLNVHFLLIYSSWKDDQWKWSPSPLPSH